MGVSADELMRRVWRGATSQDGQGEERKGGQGFIARDVTIWAIWITR